MSEAALRPVLVYNRIDHNRRRTALLLLVFGVVPLPLFLGVLGYLAELFLIVLVLSGMAAGVTIPVQEILDQPRALAALAAGPVGLSLVVLLLIMWLQYRGASRFVLRRTGARRVSREEETELWRTVENLCIGAGLPQPQLYVIESPAANAFAAGRDPQSAVLGVTRGLLERLERRELEAVVAHELSHIGNYDIRLNSVVTAIIRTIFLPLDLVSRFLAALFRGRPMVVRVAGAILLCWLFLPILAGLVMGLVLCAVELLRPDMWSAPKQFTILLRVMCGYALYCWVAVPTLVLLLRKAISREREFLADADAVLLTRNPNALARALAKIAAPGQPLLQRHPATAHLYIAGRVAGTSRWWTRIVDAHPPIEERIARLAEMGGGADLAAMRMPPPAPPRWGLVQFVLVLLAFLAVFALSLWLLQPMSP